MSEPADRWPRLGERYTGIGAQACGAGRPCRRRRRSSPIGCCRYLLTGQAHVDVDDRDTQAVQRAGSGATAVVNALSVYVESRSACFQSIDVDAAATDPRGREGGRRSSFKSSASVSTAIRPRRTSAPAPSARSGCARQTRPASYCGPVPCSAKATPSCPRVTLLVQGRPVIPLFGSSATRLQPVHVDDVACAVVAAIERETRPARHSSSAARKC